MARRIEITESELLEALRTARPTADTGPADACTLLELADAMAVNERTARKALHRLWRAGRIECVRVTRPAMDGRLSNVPAYRVVKPAKAVKAVKAVTAKRPTRRR
jgi:DNA-binding transcriptional regulator PaaX